MSREPWNVRAPYAIVSTLAEAVGGDSTSSLSASFSCLTPFFLSFLPMEEIRVSILRARLAIPSQNLQLDHNGNYDQCGRLLAAWTIS